MKARVAKKVYEHGYAVRRDGSRRYSPAQDKKASFLFLRRWLRFDKKLGRRVIGTAMQDIPKGGMGWIQMQGVWSV